MKESFCVLREQNDYKKTMTVHDRECIENVINNPLKKRLIEDVTETAQL